MSQNQGDRCQDKQTVAYHEGCQQSRRMENQLRSVSEKKKRSLEHKRRQKIGAKDHFNCALKAVRGIWRRRSGRRVVERGSATRKGKLLHRLNKIQRDVPEMRAKKKLNPSSLALDNSLSQAARRR